MNIKYKKVLVTGADGFIGSHLTEALVRKGYDVRAFVYYNSFNSWGWLDYCDNDVKGNFEIFLGDVRDPYGVSASMNDCDAVFHLAALIAIPYSYHSPDTYVDTNVKGTLNILQAARDHEINRVIHTSTSEVYGTAQYIPIDEKHPLQPQSPYSATKIAADSIAMSFYNSFNLPVTIARPFNTYGPRQSARAVIPTIITQIANGVEEIKLGNVKPTRDFNYVDDTCRGLIAIAEADNVIGKTINIGSNSEISIEEVFNLIKDIMSSNVSLSSDEKRIRPNSSEVYRLCCDNTLIRELTGFYSQIEIKDGLKKTIEWLTRPEILVKYKSHIYNV